MANGVIALIGRPNVGKSTLFNRLIQERVAIVFDTPGVTRDRIYGTASWLTNEFKVIDTGGIAKNKDLFQDKIKEQAETAIAEADVIIFIVDGKIGLVEDDHLIASLLHRTDKPVIVAVNKVESISDTVIVNEFYALGFKSIFPVSAAHGIGTGDLMDEVIHLLPKGEIPVIPNVIKMTLIGRPNVGKSSLINAITSSERAIVSEIPGTTRDVVDIAFNFDNQDYLLVDTAGLRRRSKRAEEAIEKFSALRTLRAIEKSDVCLCVIDAAAGFLEQDKHVIGYALEQSRGIIIVANKWDISDDDKNDFRNNLYKILPAISYCPILFTSALTKAGIKDLIPTVKKVHTALTQKIATAQINDLLVELQHSQPAPSFNGGNLRIYYGLQDQVNPPQFTFFVNDPQFLHFSYQRYIENRFRESLNFLGVPLTFKFRKKI